MEELKEVSTKEKQAFKKHNYRMARAFDKLSSQKTSPVSRPSSILTPKE